MSIKRTIIIILIFHNLYSFAQLNKEIEKVNLDSLQSVLPNLEGTDHIDALNKIFLALFVIDPDSSIQIANMAIELSEQLNYQKGRADGFHNKAISYNKMAIWIFNQISEHNYETSATIRMGYLYCLKTELDSGT